MNENLKVNAKSTILEFKRKHNQLVDKVNMQPTKKYLYKFNSLILLDGEDKFVYCSSFSVFSNIDLEINSLQSLIDFFSVEEKPTFSCFYDQNINPVQFNVLDDALFLYSIASGTNIATIYDVDTISIERLNLKTGELVIFDV